MTVNKDEIRKSKYINHVQQRIGDYTKQMKQLHEDSDIYKGYESAREELEMVVREIESGTFDAPPAAKEEAIRQRDAEIERLREIIGTATYELEQLERVLDMPKRGYVRNGYNGVLRTLHEVEMCPRCKERPVYWDGRTDYKLCLPCFTSNA